MRSSTGTASAASSSGGEPLTTNNRMELMAAIEALETLKRPMRVVLFTDSQYLRQGITEWIDGWRARGWRTADKKPVKNQDLWERLDAARKQPPGRMALAQGPCRPRRERARATSWPGRRSGGCAQGSGRQAQGIGSSPSPR